MVEIEKCKRGISALILLGTFFSGVGNGGVTCAASNVSSAVAGQGTASGGDLMWEYTTKYSSNNKDIDGVKYKISLDANSYKVSLSLWQEKTNSYAPVTFEPRIVVGFCIDEIKDIDKRLKECKSESERNELIKWRNSCLRSLGYEVATSHFYPDIDKCDVGDRVRYFFRRNTDLVAVIVYLLIIVFVSAIAIRVSNRKKPGKIKVVREKTEMGITCTENLMNVYV